MFLLFLPPDNPILISFSSISQFWGSQTLTQHTFFLKLLSLLKSKYVPHMIGLVNFDH